MGSIESIEIKLMLLQLPMEKILSGINDEKFELFYRGEIVPLIEDNGDFLFYGRRNDGSLDSLLISRWEAG